MYASQREKKQMISVPSRWLIASIIFVFVLSFSSFSILKNRQLLYMGGMAEEHCAMGINLFYYGRLSPVSIGERIFRPPGYPVFITLVLKVWGGMPEDMQTFLSPKFEPERKELSKVICLAQYFLLSLSALILFLFLSTYIRLHNAAVLATLFGCNPYMIILTGLLHYDLFHIFLVITSIYSLSSAIRNGKGKHYANFF